MNLLIEDPIEAFNRLDNDEYEELQKRPVCDCCGEPITSESLYKIGGSLYCEDCMNGFRHHTDDYITEADEWE